MNEQIEDTQNENDEKNEENYDETEVQIEKKSRKSYGKETMNQLSPSFENKENDDETEVMEEKKSRRFYGREFKHQLSSNSAYNSLKEFVRLCAHEQAQDYALEYLESGGNCLQIIRILDTLENKSASNCVPILEALTIVLLKIISSFPQKQLNGEDACRELLNKHFTVLKSCLSLSSNTIQRIVVLKLLATMVTLTEKLAKEILGQIFFDDSNLQILTCPSNVESGKTVRTSFIHFLLSFLIEGQKDVIDLLLQKYFLLQSVFPGLIYDTPEIINIFLSTLQTNILENVEISKTEKMGIFSHKIVQNLINLYEWKGPKNYNPKKKQISIAVNAEDKQEVCELAHQFLIILCTNRRFGIIFQDEFLGLSQIKHNNLISNVITSLNKPWNRTFISDLVIKICISCPDVFRAVLHEVESSLEVRLSKNWLNVVNFLKSIIDQLEVSRIVTYLPKLSAKQLFNAIQMFCVPQNVLKMICNEGLVHQHAGIRHQAFSLLYSMLDSLEKYLNAISNKQNISSEHKQYLKDTLKYYLVKNLAPSTIILQNWRNFSKTDDSIVPIPEFDDHLGLILDVLYKYKTICPDLIDNITKELEINDFLKIIEDMTDTKTIEMQIKAINLFINCDASFFHPSKELFSHYFPLVLRTYHENESTRNYIEPILVKIFNLTGIFEGCQHEIHILLYSILELETVEGNFWTFLTEVVKNTTEHFLKYNKELNSLQDKESDSTFSIKSWLKNKRENKTQVKMKHKILGPLAVGLLNELLDNNSEILNSNIILAHLLFVQTNPNIFVSLLLQEKYKSIISKYLLKYCKKFDDISSFDYLNKLLKLNGTFSTIINYFIGDLSNIDLSKENLPTSLRILVLNFIIFYYTRCISLNKLNIIVQKKSLETITLMTNSDDEEIVKNCLSSIFTHPVIFEQFSVTENKNTVGYMCTEFIVEIIEHLKTKNVLETYISCFRQKLVLEICNLLENLDEEKKYEKLLQIIKIFGFNFEQSCEIIQVISNLSFMKYKTVIVSDILSYILSKNYDTLNVFSDKIIQKIGNNLWELNKSESIFENIENSLCQYINKFPHINKNFGPELFSSLILKPSLTKSSIKLATILLKYNKTLIEPFGENLNKISDKRELVFSILNVIKNYENSDQIFEKIYGEYEQLILKFINKPQKVPIYMSENYEVIGKLVQNYMKKENICAITSKVQKFDVTELYHSKILFLIFNKSILAEKDDEKKLKIVTNFTLTFIHLLINILKRQNLENESSKIENLSTDFNTHLIKIKNVYKIKYTDETIYKNSAFQNFSKLCLKVGLQSHPILIKLLRQICILTSSENAELGTIFEMAIAHSESLDIILSNSDTKPPLLNLFLTLCQKCPNVMTKQHIPVWLGAYSGRLSESDQYLLRLLRQYEKANIGFHEYRPYLWGQGAITHYSVQTGGYNSLWKQPRPRDVLGLFNEEKIKRTVLNFPHTRSLEFSDALFSDSDLDVYDPAFYLPLLSHILAPESTVRWYNVTNKGIISLVIICLTSECKNIRAAACHVLSRLYNHIEAAHTNYQCLLWRHLIESLCRGTAALDDLSLANPVAIFLCQCAFIFTKPDHLLYKSLGNFIMAKECPNFNQVPELLEMLFNTSVQYKINREFILTVIRDGLKTEKDLKMIFHNMVFKLIMDFYNSTLCDFTSKKLILQIISNSVDIPLGSQILTTSYSLLSWLQGILHKISENENELLIYFTEILNNLVKNLLSSRLKLNKFKLLLIFVSTIEILKHSQIEFGETVKFVKNLYSIYEKRPDILNQSQLEDLLMFCAKFVDCSICYYYLKFGIEFYESPVLNSENNDDLLKYYIELLTIKWIQANR